MLPAWNKSATVTVLSFKHCIIQKHAVSAGIFIDYILF